MAMQRSRAEEDPQAGMFDHEIDDPEFEAALRAWIATSDERKEHGRLARRIKKMAEMHGVPEMTDALRVRVGSMTFDVRERHGGGFEVPEWQKSGMAGIRSLIKPV